MIFHTYEWKEEYKPSSLMKGNDLYQNLEDLQIKFLIRINTVPELKDKFIVK